MKNKIKEVLKEKGINQKQLCQKIGMSEAGLSNAINGSASRDTIKKIANALDVSETELIEEQLYAKFSADKTPLKLGDISIPCYVLNNGMRVFSGRGIQKALGANKNASGTWLTNFVNSNTIISYLPPGVIEKFNNPVEFKRVGAGGSQSTTYAYEATLLIDLCTSIIDAFESRTSGISEMQYTTAKTIVKAVAKVGIIALIDEATGYIKEKSRAKNELQKFLADFINQEASAWIKTFSDEFFEDIYRMRHWTWEDTSKRPSFIGKIINDIVYERIAPAVLEELKRLNPKNANGNRKYRYHQFLTSEIGKPALQKHLAILHSFAVASDYQWWKFMLMLDKAHPKQYQQLVLFDDYDIG